MTARATLAFAVACAFAPSLARADLATPPRAAAKRRAPKPKVFLIREPVIVDVDDELKTHEPTVAPRSDSSTANSNSNAADANGANGNATNANAASVNANANAAVKNFAEPIVAEREFAGPEQPLDFVDATLEAPDLAARFTSARPVWKRVPASLARKHGAAK